MSMRLPSFMKIWLCLWIWGLKYLAGKSPCNKSSGFPPSNLGSVGRGWFGTSPGRTRISQKWWQISENCFESPLKGYLGYILTKFGDLVPTSFGIESHKRIHGFRIYTQYMSAEKSQWHFQHWFCGSVSRRSNKARSPQIAIWEEKQEGNDLYRPVASYSLFS